MFISHAGARKKNKVKPLTWLCDWRIFELQFVAALLLFYDAEMYVGLSDGFRCVTMSAFRSTVSIHEVLEVDHFGVM